MNCARLSQVLDAWVDSELDPATSADIRRHVEECAACAALERQRRALSQAIRGAAPCYRVPPELRARVRSAVSAERAPSATRALSWPQAAAIAGCAAVLSALLTFWSFKPSAEGRFAEQVAASHVASLTHSRRLVAIESGERHTVKPWFQGKVDFAPGVKDLSGAGFTLVGGRVDHVGERQAAAVVYRIRNHVVNVFVWHTHLASGSSPAAEKRLRGFTILSWTDEGLRYAAISDVDPRDLRRLAEHMRSH